MVQKYAIAGIAFSVGLAALGGMASAKPALKDVAHVREGIITTGMAYEITQKCDSISPRYLRALNYLQSLKNHAKELGYSGREIDAYTGDKAEEARLTAVARIRLANLGAVSGDAASYCAVGQAEIAKGSAIGRLMR